ncbi:unnamed protein product [Bursaphelenchus xylophilus]|uniref:(pine wood nematode) hypothetical protein n=1 Tax=Bursaphelenchus xylophilus TaxID=6326 RepID=A0A1I7RPS6_BURXY|nr:unnamed protein product [Bursaphelenchus xylophilus]CAG9096539.1 unnamed protein product [Bursaphelenchus xylophilus]
MEIPSGSKKSNLTFSNATIESSDDDESSSPENEDLTAQLHDFPFDSQKYKNILTAAKSVLERDSVFVRARGDLLSEIEELSRRFQSAPDLSSEGLFCLYELMDDSLENCIDLNSAHLAILRYHALQLSKFTPLEVLETDDDIPIEEQENEEVEISDNTPHLPVKKVKKVEEPKVNKNKRKEEALSTVSTRNSSQNSKNENGYPEPKVKKNHIKKVEENSVRKSNSTELRNGKKAEKKEKQPEISVKEEEDDEKMEVDEGSDDESKEDPIETRRNTRRAPADKLNGNNEKIKKVITRSKRSGTPDSEKPRRKSAIDSLNNSTTTRQSAQRRAKLQNETNPDEQTYCLCDQISYGQMIGCDNLHCSIEWFHFECVDIKAKPAKGVKWFCPLCRGDKSSVLKPGLKR